MKVTAARGARAPLLSALLLIVTLLVPLAPGSANDGGPAPAETVKARQRFFGKANVDPRSGKVRADRVILSWFSVSSYAVAMRGHVFFLDAWIARGSHSGYVPTTTEELIALDPELIFVGHGDFDHDADIAEVASATEAAVVGSPEHCDSMKEQSGDDSIRCIEAAPAGAPGGLRRELDLIPGVDISAVTHIHSSVERPEPDDPRSPCPPLWNPQDSVEHPPSPEDVEHLARHGGDARGVNLLYQFRVGEFALAWHDTTGKIEEDSPETVEALRSLPHTDIQFGAVLAFGQVTNCMRSLGQYVRALSPTIYTPNHHDNFVVGAGDNSRDLEPYVREEIGRIPKGQRPRILWTDDPDDYLNPAPFTFDPADRVWR